MYQYLFDSSHDEKKKNKTKIPTKEEILQTDNTFVKDAC